MLIEFRGEMGKRSEEDEIVYENSRRLPEKEGKGCRGGKRKESSERIRRVAVRVPSWKGDAKSRFLLANETGVDCGNPKRGTEKGVHRKRKDRNASCLRPPVG